MTDTVTQILSDCKALGIRLIVMASDSLTIDAPRDVLTPELMARLKSNKSEVLTRLQAPASEFTREPDKPERQPSDGVELRCQHLDRSRWRDAAVDDGRIRTTCEKCGRWIGYRPSKN